MYDLEIATDFTIAKYLGTINAIQHGYAELGTADER